MAFVLATAGRGIDDFQPLCTRLADGGETWSRPAALWPHLKERNSITVSVVRIVDRETIAVTLHEPTPADPHKPLADVRSLPGRGWAEAVLRVWA